MSARRSWCAPASLLVIAIVALGLAVPAHAQEPPATQVTIEPVGTDGIAGLALLRPSASGGTNVQIIVSGAPSGTFAVVHAGSCDDIDPTPVALLGDVSATSQVATPDAFDTLTDGAHVLALHAGLDLATAVGCGAIPAAAAQPSAEAQPSPATSLAPAATGGRFAATDGSFAIDWPAGWEAYDVAPVEGQQRLGLAMGLTSVLLAGRRDPAADAQACVRDARQELLDRLDAGAIRDLAPLATTDGAMVSGVEAGRAWLGYRYTSIEDGREFAVADYLECRAAGGSVVYVLHRSTPDAYIAAAADRDTLLAGLTLGAGVATRSSDPVPAASAGTNVVEPDPTPSTECEGYDVWHDGTLARIDQLAQLRSDVDEATNEAARAFDLTEYKLTLKRAVRDLARMGLEQRGQQAPPAAQDAQALAVGMFDAYHTAAQVLSEYYESSTNQATLERAERAQNAASRARDDLDDALVAVEAACE